MDEPSCPASYEEQCDSHQNTCEEECAPEGRLSLETNCSKSTHAEKHVGTHTEAHALASPTSLDGVTNAQNTSTPWDSSLLGSGGLGCGASLDLPFLLASGDLASHYICDLGCGAFLALTTCLPCLALTTGGLRGLPCLDYLVCWSQVTWPAGPFLPGSGDLGLLSLIRPYFPTSLLPVGPCDLACLLSLSLTCRAQATWAVRPHFPHATWAQRPRCSYGNAQGSRGPARCHACLCHACHPVRQGAKQCAHACRCGAYRCQCARVCMLLPTAMPVFVMPATLCKQYMYACWCESISVSARTRVYASVSCK
eukprot:scaffold62463_cov21-Tisochrysis_lutea.AAC.1